jgi:hypothetical protein
MGQVISRLPLPQPAPTNPEELIMATKSKKRSTSKKAGKKSKPRRASVVPFAAWSSKELKSLVAAKNSLSQELLQKRGIQRFSALSTATSPAPSDNLVGVGVGEKIIDGRYTGVLCVKLLVRFKYTEDQLTAEDRLPKTINGLPTDVEQVGTFRKFEAVPAITTPNPRTRIRPAPPGCSVGFRDPGNSFVMAGTFGALVKRGQRRFILSNNHVLADENRLPQGSPIFQPGLRDGGNPTTDQIAQLSAFVQLQAGAPNVIDGAIAEVANNAPVTNSILVIGRPQGAVAAQRDMVVHKFGRTTGYTVGRITSINTDVLVDYDLGALQFNDQIIIRGLNNQPFSASGDSGSLIVERSTGRAVGLLFAGSSTDTIANHIGDVLQALNVTLA